jgi:uncharacterized protein (DUF58 family)
MLTARGWWFLMSAVVLVVGAGLLPPPRGHPTLLAIGTTLLAWFFAQWLIFAVRVRWAVSRLALDREVRDERGPVDNLWAGRSFQVRARLRTNGVIGLPYVLAIDRVPFGVEAGDGLTRYEGEIGPRQPAEFSYRIFCPATGRVRFEGVRMQLADLQGFFYHAAFVPDARSYRVLPMLVDAEGRGPTTKRHNLLPPPGVHRLRRPGTGSELLDLRDYLPGDPPKMIAWKVSARRDRLITKEFESEVPVRCTLFVDTSNSVRLGVPGQNALSKQVDIAAAIAQATVGARDLIGLCIFDEHQTSVLRPARTPQHLSTVLNRLADAAGLAPAQGKVPIDTLLPAAYAFADEVYPHLLRRELNAFPWWLPWLTPQPVSTHRHPTLFDRLFRLPGWYYRIYSGGLKAFTLLSAVLLYFSLYPDDPVIALVWLAASFLFLVGGFLLGLVLFPIFWLLFRNRRARARWRKQLAALLSVRHGLAPGGLGLLLEDDDLFSLHLQQFLAEHQVPYSLPLFDRKGNYLFRAPEKVAVLAKQLTRAVAQSHDNELFVLLVDLLEIPEHLGTLFRAVKVALARHHQVLVVCPWLPGVPPPSSRDRRAPFSHAPFRQASDQPVPLTQLLRQATTLRFHEAFHRLRRNFARIGVQVLCAQDQDPAPLIVERLERLRAARIRLGVR